MTKSFLSHHGIKGQKWGIRRFQNNDGTLTAEGRKRYDVNDDGTVQMKSSFRKNQYLIGGAKTAIGSALVTRSVLSVMAARKTQDGLSSKSGKKILNKAIFGALLGSFVIGSSAKNFINANRNKTFNSSGMGDTPENFHGRPKSIAQVLAAQKRSQKR